MLRGATKGLFNLGRKGASEAVKSDYAKQKVKDVANKYLDQALDRFISDLSKKLDPVSGGALGGNTKAYCGIEKVPTGKHRGSMKECYKQNQIRYFGIKPVNEIDMGLWRWENMSDTKKEKEEAKLKRRGNKSLRKSLRKSIR